jgi:hypothetical protein
MTYTGRGIFRVGAVTFGLKIYELQGRAITMTIGGSMDFIMEQIYPYYNQNSAILSSLESGKINESDQGNCRFGW